MFGQCDFDVDALTSDFHVRNGLKEDDFDEHYMVLGLFGDHQNDDGLLPGTRWVSRSELDEFCAASDLTLLSQWESAGALPGKRPGNRGRSRLRPVDLDSQSTTQICTMLHYTVMHLVHLAFCVEVGALCVCVS